MKKAVFLDRDGTVIFDKIYLNDVAGVEYLPDVHQQLKRIYDAGYLLFIVTNQSGVARGIVQIENIDKIHHKIQTDAKEHAYEYAAFYYAPYSVESNHPLRKPNPGMLELGQKEFALDMAASWMVGDRDSDVEAGHRAGCRSIFLAGNEEEKNKTSKFAPAEFYAENLKQVADFILSNP